MTQLPKASELPIGPTQAAKEMNPNEGRVAQRGARLLVSGDAYEDKPEGYDHSYVSDREARDMGVNPDTHVMCMIRNPDIWQGLEKSDRGHEFLRVGGRVIPLNENGKPYMNGDLIYAAKSREEVEARERAELADTKQYKDGLDGQANLGDQQRYEAGNLQQRQRDVEREHQRNVMDGIIGPTAGRSYLDVIRENPDRYARDKAHYSGVQGGAAQDDEGIARIDAARREASGGGKLISIPANVRSRNHAGAKK